ncbi:class I SAM-dependent methyltransferase [Demequina sp. SYSU T00192]|uniref:Class I SAM-dependent methyltransferase n=1 Tax=Demequina litoralis TaxID=3051660 RepID=A0ABT8G930_9MICO|nr:class I SAM-dependent methyltransferase [Demequina sp. SYSU T00192]MDN4475649.1 class I SAM-dependent methyltransferase [Demequina sp. SYSU T00192]
MTDRSTSFGQAAADYARGRPGYPDDAVAWMLDGVEGLVVDVGAGTGKLTEAVLRARHDVLAVDPDPVMLATLEAHVPRARTLRGRAEEIPLPDASAGAVVLGQAWHWVDVEAASAEIARVLAPGGVLGLVWNIRDERDPWVAALTRIIGHSAAEILIAEGGPRVAAPFGPLETHESVWTRPITASSLHALVRSRSGYITGPDALKRDIDTALDALIARTDGLADGGEVAMPYVTHAFRARVAG